LQGLLAAQGLHGFLAAQGLQGFLAAHGLQGFFAAHGLHGFLAAQGLHGLQPAAIWMPLGLGLAVGRGVDRPDDVAGVAAWAGPAGTVLLAMNIPAPTNAGIRVVERSWDFIDLTVVLHI